MFKLAKDLLLSVYLILRRYSDRQHPLLQENIQDYLSKHFGIDGVSRMSLYRYLNELESILPRLHRQRKGVYLDEILSDSQSRIVSMPLIAAPFLAGNAVRELVNSIGEQLTERQHFLLLKLLYMSKCYNHAEHCDFGGNLDLIQLAIDTGRKLEFVYSDIDRDKKPSPRCNRHRSAVYKVSVYDMLYYNGFFYIVVKDDFHDNLSNYRIDKMSDLVITEERAQPVSSVPEYREKRYRTEDYLLANYKMFGGTTELIKVRVRARTAQKHNYFVNILWDEFGARIVEMRGISDRETVAYIRVCRAGMRNFALQFADFVEVIDHDELRGEMYRLGLDMVKKYAPKS